MNQTQVADILDWSQSKLSRLENGKVPYTQDILEALANAYSCDPSDLLVVNPLEQNGVFDLTQRLQRADQKTREQAARILDAFLNEAS